MELDLNSCLVSILSYLKYEYGLLLFQGIELAQNSVKHPIDVSSKIKY